MRGDLPRGTVTFLFTDIEGSTRLLHALGPDAYAQALAEHRRAIREAFAARGGVEVDTQGDAFFVAFPTADGAAAAALAANEALSAGPIRVRMGLHTGAPAVTDEGYVGIDVHRGARVGALAHGGQIVISPATAALLDGRRLGDLGLHRLKDFDGATRLFQLGDGEFPALRTPGSVDLPTPATAFIGRERELLEGISIVFDRDPRVLTVIGPGGTGKTRFAIELARLLAEEAEGGTLFVPLAPVRDPALVLHVLGEALGSQQYDPGAIAGRLRGMRTHVVVDNLEQLLPDAARPLAELAEAAPALRLLVTSREALRIGAETELDLPPLPADDAAELFVARARAVRPDVEPSAAVDELCERLDRLPLAVELAAARTKLLSPEALLQRIGARLDLRAPRDADPRHATLEATIAWSYELLAEDERRLFARLAVFRGGCTLEAAERVCDAEMDTLESLLDKSLLRRREAAGTDRFWMLETIREFAFDRLAESGDEDAVRRAHALWLLNLATRSERVVHEMMRREELELMAGELDNVRTALEWALTHAPNVGLELAVALEEFWVIREPVEGAGWEKRLLDAAVDAPPELRAAGWRALGGALDIVGAFERAGRCLRTSLELFELAGDPDEAAFLRFRVGANAVNAGDTATGWPLIEAALEDFRRQANPAREAQALSYLAWKAADEDDDLERAVGLTLESAALVRTVGWNWWEGGQLVSAAEFERRRGNHAAAERHAREALAIATSIGDRMFSVFAAGEIASAAAARGDPVAAGRLWGAIEREETAGAIGQWPTYRAEHEERVLQVAGTELEHARAEGRLLTLAEAAALPDA